MPKYFLFEKSGVVTTVTFNRPERRNCLDTEVILELERLIYEVRDDRETRALIVTGTGNAFSAGADLSAIRGIEDPRQRDLVARERAGRRLPRLIGRVFEAIATWSASPLRRSTDTRSEEDGRSRSPSISAWPWRTPSSGCRK